MGDAGRRRRRRRRSQLELVDEDKSPLLGKKGSPDLGSFIGHESSSFFPRSSVAGTAREFMAWRAFALSLSPPPNNHHLLLLLPFLFRCPYKRHQSARNQPSLSLSLSRKELFFPLHLRFRDWRRKTTKKEKEISRHCCIVRDGRVVSLFVNVFRFIFCCCFCVFAWIPCDVSVTRLGLFDDWSR